MLRNLAITDARVRATGRDSESHTGVNTPMAALHHKTEDEALRSVETAASEQPELTEGGGEGRAA